MTYLDPSKGKYIQWSQDQGFTQVHKKPKISSEELKTADTETKTAFLMKKIKESSLSPEEKQTLSSHLCNNVHKKWGVRVALWIHQHISSRFFKNTSAKIEQINTFSKEILAAPSPSSPQQLPPQNPPTSPTPPTHPIPPLPPPPPPPPSKKERIPKEHKIESPPSYKGNPTIADLEQDYPYWFMKEVHAAVTDEIFQAAEKEKVQPNLLSLKENFENHNKAFLSLIMRLPDLDNTTKKNETKNRYPGSDNLFPTKETRVNKAPNPGETHEIPPLKANENPFYINANHVQDHNLILAGAPPQEHLEDHLHVLFHKATPSDPQSLVGLVPESILTSLQKDPEGNIPFIHNYMVTKTREKGSAKSEFYDDYKGAYYSVAPLYCTFIKRDGTEEVEEKLIDVKTFWKHSENEPSYLGAYLLLELKNTKENKTVYVLQHHFFAWPDFGIPDAAGSYLFGDLLLDSFHAEKEGVTSYIHCSAGVGRSGTFATVEWLMLGIYRSLLADPDRDDIEVDIAKAVDTIRESRRGAVQSTEQFLYIEVAVGMMIPILRKLTEKAKARGEDKPSAADIAEAKEQLKKQMAPYFV